MSDGEEPPPPRGSRRGVRAEPYRILVVDDEPSVRFGVRQFLEGSGYAVDEAESCQAAEAAFRGARPDAVILDYLLPDGNSLELLPRLKAIDATVPLLILTAHGSIDLAVRAVKEGAEQFLTKPVEMPTLVVVLERLLENSRHRKRELAVRSREERDTVDPFAGKSAAMRRLADEAARVAGSDSPILIQGETGTGKGVLAAWLHRNGPRADEPFVDINCASFTRDLLETELFGHEKGAFTGAAFNKMGLLEVAHRGTVFLDEIGDLDLDVQPKLLKVVEDKRFRRLGDTRDRRVDVRLIVASHQDLGARVKENKFRSDLLFRINTLPLRVPALRDRAEDVPLLAARIAEGLSADLGRGPITLSEEARTALQRYPWPGNIRELRNVLERAVLLSGRSRIDAQDLRFDASLADPRALDSNLTLEEVERRHIQRVLEEERGKVDQAARRLGVPRSSLYEKLKRHGIAVSRS